MIALRYLQMTLVKDFLDTPEEVRGARRRLEEATEESFRKYDEARRRVRHIAEHTYLD